MSKIICTSAIDGAVAWVARAEKKIDEAISQKGENARIAFPDTAYYLPVIYSLTGEKAASLSDLRRILRTAKDLLPERPSEKNHLPYLGGALDAGAASLFACEIIEACNYLIGPDPVHGIWLGAAGDSILRERGVEFVDGTAPGFAAITGAAPSAEIAVKIARELQEKNLYVFMAGSTNGVQFAEQLEKAGIQLGWATRLVPFGSDVSSLIFALGFASRVALSFGGVKPGDGTTNLLYNKSRVFAFVLALGEIDIMKYAVAAGAINYGFPVIADSDIPQILPTGVTTYEHVVSKVPYDSMVERALEVRGCKVKITEVPIPVPYGAAFEGERIRKQDVRVEFGGNITPAFEFVTAVELDEIEDGKIKIIGPDIDSVEIGTALPLAIWVEVAGRKMQSDFEAILERQIHHLINGAEGIWHMGQRDIVWTRVSKSGFDKGIRLRHYGDILHAMFLSNFPAIVDKVAVTLVTDRAEVEKRLAHARNVYSERNRRMASMTDESVDTFYSCLLCQSFAPNHVCVITPERLGLCGAYNWLDGRAAYEIDETGPNQPVKKGEILDPIKGVWSGVNEYVFANSHRAISSVTAYSIMDRPMTSCGCFEVILAYIPEANGIIAVNREYSGDTPAGMGFSTLAGNVGGGAQTPGFMGCGKVFLTSKKFIYAEGGHRRLVWMPTSLKEQIGDELKALFDEGGYPDLFEKIADETTAISPADLTEHMKRVDHPALSMPDMADYAESHDAAGPRKESHNPKGPVDTEEISSKTNETGISAGPISPESLDRIKSELLSELRGEIKKTLTVEIVTDIIDVLSLKFLGGNPDREPAPDAAALQKTAATARTAGQKIDSIKSFTVRRDKAELAVHRVKLGATKKEGGTRGISHEIGGAGTMPFHLFEGEMPNRPLVAMEVFDRPSEKYPEALKQFWGDAINDPARMAKTCVEKYGADLISLRLDSTHPDRGNTSPDDALKTVKKVLSAVEVPLIITGHNHFDSINDVMKLVARECAGERLLLNWAEQDNYRLIAGAAMAYGHPMVAMSPIDVNIAKQLSILITGMGLSHSEIVIDPMTGALGYGLEYTYSIMERIRSTGIHGDTMLASPMIVSPGFECAKIKELRAGESEFPAWGNLEKRAAIWELTTAVSFLYAGADVLIMYNPNAALELKKTIYSLME
jgi:acetyl-CoA synthase